MNAALRRIAPFGAGVLFALGLGLSRMTDATVVLGFLDVLNGWQPALVLVMVAGIGTHALSRFLIAGRAGFVTQGWTEAWRSVDRDTVVGAALFGLGWGVGGFCPGPAVVGVVTGAPEVIVFVAGMAGGMVAHAVTARHPDPSIAEDCTVDGLHA